MKAHLIIPIYGGIVVMRVGKSIREERQRENRFLGVCTMTDEELDDAGGLMCWSGSHYGIFFDYRLNPGVLAHEVFHLTHHILGSCGAKFVADNHEPFSYLNQFLTDWVYQQLKKTKTRINR